MASTPVRALLPSGLGTLTLRLYAVGGTTVAHTSAVAESAVPRRWEWTVTEDLSGTYEAVVTNAGGSVIGGGLVTLEDDTGVYHVDRWASQASVDANTSTLMANNSLIDSTRELVVLTSNDIQASVDAVAEDVGQLTSNGGVASTAPARRAGNRVEVEIVRGDTYADGLANGALDFDEQAWWPADLAGATITLTARYRRGRHDTTDPTIVLTKAGSVVSATTPQEVRVELTAAETAAAAVGTHEYDVQATLSTGEVVTLAGPGWPFVVRGDQTV